MSLPLLKTERRCAFCGEPLDEAVAVRRFNKLFCDHRHAQRYELKHNPSFKLDIDMQSGPGCCA